MRILKIIKIKTEYIETLEESSDWAETPDKIGEVVNLRGGTDDQKYCKELNLTEAMRKNEMT